MLPIKDGPLAVWRNFICKINIYAWDQKQTERPRGVHAAAALMRSWTDRRAQSCNSRRVSVQERRQVACDHRCPVCDWAYGAVGDEKSMSMPLWWCVHACSMSCRARHQGRGHNQSVLCPPVQDWCPSLVAGPNLRDCQTRSVRFFRDSVAAFDGRTSRGYRLRSSPDIDELSWCRLPRPSQACSWVSSAKQWWSKGNLLMAAWYSQSMYSGRPRFTSHESWLSLVDFLYILNGLHFSFSSVPFGFVRWTLTSSSAPLLTNLFSTSVSLYQRTNLADTVNADVVQHVVTVARSAVDHLLGTAVQFLSFHSTVQLTRFTGLWNKQQGSLISNYPLALLEICISFEFS